LFGISPSDPATLAVVTLALVCAGMAACWLPARRAAALDPVRALRYE
jgi:putative ABC transport system permease protein